MKLLGIALGISVEFNIDDTGRITGATVMGTDWRMSFSKEVLAEFQAEYQDKIDRLLLDDVYIGEDVNAA